MSTFDPTATFLKLQTMLTATQNFPGGVLIGEPFSPPKDLAAAIFSMADDPGQATLGTEIDVFTVHIRLYYRPGMTPENAQTAEIALAVAFFQLKTTLAGAFTLGGTVRAIDWVGEEQGHRVMGKWGHLDISSTIFRVVDLTIPLIVDDSATFAA